MEHIFTTKIKEILRKHFAESSQEVYETSILIQYLNEKTKSATLGSKARGSFGSIYSIYTLIEDYISKGFDKKEGYSEYEGASFKSLLSRARQLPFGSKTQNHSFNNRTNHEFRKYFSTSSFQPIIHKPETRKYWINENLIKIKIGKQNFNIAVAVIEIIDEYVKTKQDSFQRFIKACEGLQKIRNSELRKVEEFIIGLLAPNVDARLFEIISYAILKYYYADQKIYWSFELKIETFKEETLILYKTGRTNANDGGIDFVMKPLGRFFQVTETLDFKKYFLDIDKLQKYPVTFVVKSNEETHELSKKIESDALKTYAIKEVVEKYMNCIEEIINIPKLKEQFQHAIEAGYLKEILDEIVLQSRVEFNYDDLTERSE